MTLAQLKELVWDWHQHKTDAFSYPTTVIMDSQDLEELINDCGNDAILSGKVQVNKVLSLDIAVWEDPEKEPMIF